MIEIITDFPIAFESMDHIQPGGTAQDNWSNLKFNQKLYDLFPKQKLKVLDIGCAGGGFIKTLIDAGHIGVGIEGSDYSFIRKRAEWATIPENLFTADATKPYKILIDGEDAIFDVVTCWEVMEHINKQDLPQFILNIKNHLKNGGLWIMSVGIENNIHHMTKERKPWWMNIFENSGFIEKTGLYHYFAPNWVRDQTNGCMGGFNVVLEKAC